MKYIPENNAKKIREVLETCKDMGGVIFQLIDSDGYLGTYRNVENILEEMDGGDDCITVWVMDKGEGELGYISFLPNEPEPEDVIMNYSDNTFIGRILG
nr:MAG TPA: hypothetical protein [Caudoviricetes sp.]